MGATPTATTSPGRCRHSVTHTKLHTAHSPSTAACYFPSTLATHLLTPSPGSPQLFSPSDVALRLRGRELVEPAEAWAHFYPEALREGTPIMGVPSSDEVERTT